MDYISKDTLKLHRELRAEKESSLIRSNLPEFQNLTPEQYERYKKDFKADENVDVYQSDEEYFNGLKSVFKNYSEEDLNRSATKFAALKDLTDMDTDEKHSLMRRKLHGISGRSSKKRVKKVADMNRYAEQIKNAYVNMSIDSARNAADPIEQKYNMLKSKFDILELEKMYQYKYIKAFGSKDAYEKERLAQLEYECQLKRQGILNTLDELNKENTDSKLRKQRLMAIRSLQADMKPIVEAAKADYEKARSRDVVEFKKHIPVDEFNIVTNDNVQTSKALYKNELDMESVRSGEKKGDAARNIVNEYGKLHYSDLTEDTIKKSEQIDSHNVEMIKRICRAELADVQDKDLEKYQCITVLLNRDIVFDKEGKLKDNCRRVDDDNAALVNMLVGTDKDVPAMNATFDRYLRELSEFLEAEKSGASVSNSADTTDKDVISREFRGHSLVKAYKELENLFGAAFTDEIRQQILKDGASNYDEFIKSLSDHEKTWEEFNSRIARDGLSVLCVNGNYYPELSETSLKRHKDELKVQAEKRAEKYSWDKKHYELLVNWLIDAAENNVDISDAVLKSFHENLRDTEGHLNVMHQLEKELPAIFPKLKNFDRLAMIMFKPVCVNEDGTPQTDADMANEAYNKKMMERLKGGEEEIKKISKEILQQYIDMPELTEDMLTEEKMMDSSTIEIKKMALRYSNWINGADEIDGILSAWEDYKKENPAAYETLEKKMEVYPDYTWLINSIYMTRGMDIEHFKVDCNRYPKTFGISKTTVEAKLKDEIKDFEEYKKLPEEKKIALSKRRIADKKANNLRNEMMVYNLEQNKEKVIDCKVELVRQENAIYFEKRADRTKRIQYYRNYVRSLYDDKEFTANPKFATSRKNLKKDSYVSDINRMHMYYLLETVHMDENGNVIEQDKAIDEKNKQILRDWMNDDIDKLAPAFERIFEKIINYKLDYDPSLDLAPNTDRLFEIFEMSEMAGLVDNLRDDEKCTEWMRKRGITEDIQKILLDIPTVPDNVFQAINHQLVAQGAKQLNDDLIIMRNYIAMYDEQDAKEDQRNIKEYKQSAFDNIAAVQNDTAPNAKYSRRIFDKEDNTYLNLDQFIAMVKKENK